MTHVCMLHEESACGAVHGPNLQFKGIRVPSGQLPLPPSSSSYLSPYEAPLSDKAFRLLNV